MANAKRTVRTEEVEVKMVELREVDEVILTLTADEAQTLLRVTNLVGGSPQGRRGDIESIAKALRAAGLKDHPQFHKNPKDMGDLRATGGIIFADPDGIMPAERHRS